MVFFPCQDSILLGQFSTTVLIVKTVALCASNVVALHGSRRLKTYRRRARTSRTNKGRGAGRPLSRQRDITFNTKFVSMSKSHVTSSWLSPPVTSCPPGVDARIPRQPQWSSKESMQEVIAWVWGSVTHRNAVEQYTWALSVLIRTLLPEGWPVGMRKWKRRACCCMSWWRAHWWSCVRRVVAASRRGGRAVLPKYSVLGGLVEKGIWKHLSLYFCVVFVRVWGLLKVGLCTDSSPRKRCTLARRLLIVHTVQVWLPVSQNTSGVSIAQVLKMQINPGIDFSGADYGVVVSFHWAVFPTISQTLAEALAISMEAPMGNAKDAEEERRLRRKEDNAKVCAPRPRPSSWRRRKERPWESIWSCSAVKEVLSNQSRGKPVQFPGAEHSFFLCLHSSDTRRTCILWVSRATLFA